MRTRDDVVCCHHCPTNMAFVPSTLRPRPQPWLDKKPKPCLSSSSVSRRDDGDDEYDSYSPPPPMIPLPRLPKSSSSSSSYASVAAASRDDDDDDDADEHDPCSPSYSPPPPPKERKMVTSESDGAYGPIRRMKKKNVVTVTSVAARGGSSSSSSDYRIIMHAAVIELGNEVLEAIRQEVEQNLPRCRAEGGTGYWLVKIGKFCRTRYPANCTDVTKKKGGYSGAALLLRPKAYDWDEYGVCTPMEYIKAQAYKEKLFVDLLTHYGFDPALSSSSATIHGFDPALSSSSAVQDRKILHISRNYTT